MHLLYSIAVLLEREKMAKIHKPQLYLGYAQIEHRLRTVYAFDPTKKLASRIAQNIGFRIFRSAKSLVKEITRTVKKFCREQDFEPDVKSTYIQTIPNAAKKIACDDIWSSQIDEVTAANK